MTFIHPAENETFYAGRSYDILMNTFGLSSRWHGNTADLYLLDENYVRVTPKPILTDKEFKVLDVNQTLLRSLNGIGHMKWTIPSDLPSGKYYLKYVSGWTLWRHETKFSQVSPGFFIINPRNKGYSPRLKQELEDVLLPNGSHILVPKELSFKYPYSSGWRNNTLQVVEGILDFVAGTVNKTRNLIQTPKQSLSSIKSILSHPIQSWNSMMQKWDQDFDSNPYRGTGQALALSSILYGISFLLKKGRSPCPGGVCTKIPQTLPELKGPGKTYTVALNDIFCEAKCMRPLKEVLLTHKGIHDVIYAKHEGSNTATFQIRSSLSEKELHAILDDAGADLANILKE